MSGLSPAAERFLRQRVPTLRHLDVLLLLSRSPERVWSAPAVAAALGASIEPVRSVLEDVGDLLEVRLASDVLFRFAPWDPAVSAVLHEIAVRCVANRTALAAHVEQAG